MRIPKAIYEELLEHAREDAPNECCGLIGGEDGVAKTVYRARNAEASPLRYNLDPQDQFRIMTEMEERGEELAAIYHSHTASPAYPSQTDINLAAYPDALYLIVSLAEGETDLRGFRIVDGDVTEVDLEIRGSSEA
jgi:[CysO sulfur-carrier protein]-S-L-cysteine hydrolase